jgi:hypothetical protein
MCHSVLFHGNQIQQEKESPVFSLDRFLNYDVFHLKTLDFVKLVVLSPNLNMNFLSWKSSRVWNTLVQF